MKVVTLNVGRLIPFLNRFIPIGKNSIRKVRTQLEELDADIVFLQEIAGNRHLEQLIEGTKYHFALGPSYEDERRLENVALLSKREIRDIDYIPESHAISASIPEYDINAVNVHLHLRKKKRWEQIKLLLSKIKRRRTIIGGDFNSNAEENSFGDLRSCTSKIRSTTLYGRHIDDILHTPDVNVKSTELINCRFGLMDHYPLMATIS